MHEIDVIEFDRSDRTAAELLDGGGACPPENIGGPHGYRRMKDYLDGKMSKKEYYDWFSAADAEDFDVNSFNLEKMNFRVKEWKNLS